MSAGFGAGLRVLVVDDEPAMLAFLDEALVEWGFEVETATCRSEAAGRGARSPFDLLLVDKNLPDDHGLAVVRALANLRDDCAVMLMSGFANLSSALESIQTHVADYFLKPFDLGDFGVRLQRVVEHQALQRRNRELTEELRRKNALLESLAARDPLTTLFNRSHFHDAIQRELARSARHRLCFALVLLDVDDFRRMNEAAAHARGDEVLAAIGGIVGRETRRSDLAARYEKDTFALLLPETGKASATATAENLRRRLEQHDFGLPGLGRLTLSAGVAAYPEDGATAAELLMAAQLSLAAAKSAGGSCVLAYVRTLTAGGELQREVIRHELERRAALERTIADRAFGVVYQPIVDVRSRTVVGYEALCRPREAAFRSPTELFAAAERAGQVAALGRLVREVAVAPLAAWPEPGLLFLNIHPHELFHPGALEHEAALRPLAQRLVLEIVEWAELDAVDRAHGRIDELRAVGFHVAVDDLGAGYASLNWLARLAPDFVKLDMNLIRDLRADSRAARLIQRVVEFCREEGVTPIAEGVETADELQAVADLGVALVQGFFLGRPSPSLDGVAPEEAVARACDRRGQDKASKHEC